EARLFFFLQQGNGQPGGPKAVKNPTDLFAGAGPIVVACGRLGPIVRNDCPRCKRLQKLRTPVKPGRPTDDLERHIDFYIPPGPAPPLGERLPNLSSLAGGQSLKPHGDPELIPSPKPHLSAPMRFK